MRARSCLCVSECSLALVCVFMCATDIISRMFCRVAQTDVETFNFLFEIRDSFTCYFCS